ncbi:MAG: hypothetical protein AAGU73_02705 [Actinomycetota bacterium]
MTKRLLCALLAFGLLLVATPAHAATWSEPDITALRGTLAPGDGPWLELPWTVVWQYSEMLGGALLDPRAVERLPNGNTLITSRDGLGVYEIGADGSVVWSYTADDYTDLVPFHATRLANGNTLIVSRMQDTVLEVAPDKTIVWSYGSPEDAPKLIDPFTAFRMPNGNTLIADNQACRVLEVSASGEIVWQYGVTGQRAADNGYAQGYLDWPKWATRLANGNTLIADDEGHRVLEVTPEGTVVWSYGQAGVSGSGPGQLSHPVSAERLDDGSTLISDSGNDRVLIVATDGTVVSSIGTPGEDGLDELGLNDLRRVTITPTGTLLIADTRNSRLLELGHAASGVVTSGQIDCGLPGVRKRFTSLSVASVTPTGTAATLQYRIDSGAWKTTSGGSLPADTYGMLITYRVTLVTDDPAVTPRLTGVSIGYQPAPAQSPGDGDDDGSPGAGTGTTRPRPSARPWSRPRVPIAPRGPVSGIMNPSEGYASSQFGEPLATLEGPVTSRSGWTLERVNTEVDVDSLASDTPAPLPSPEGLILLGGLYAAGALSVPLGRAARAAASFVPTDY